MSNKVFVVTMQRWGDSEKHNYVIGAFSTRKRAEYAGELERWWRGGKYKAKIDEIEIDKIDQEIIDYGNECGVKEEKDAGLSN